MDIEKLKYPVGKFNCPDSITSIHVIRWIEEIEKLPALLKEAASEKAGILDEAYRPGGWTLRQVIHHIADSHMNSYIRFKLAATEDNPAIRPYFEDRWAELEEARTADVQISLMLIEALHRRWVAYMRTMSEVDWERTFFHPENKSIKKLKEVAGIYAWHGRHHLHHILNTR